MFPLTSFNQNINNGFIWIAAAVGFIQEGGTSNRYEPLRSDVYSLGVALGAKFAWRPFFGLRTMRRSPLITAITSEVGSGMQFEFEQ